MKRCFLLFLIASIYFTFSLPTYSQAMSDSVQQVNVDEEESIFNSQYYPLAPNGVYLGNLIDSKGNEHKLASWVADKNSIDIEVDHRDVASRDRNYVIELFREKENGSLEYITESKFTSGEEDPIMYHFTFEEKDFENDLYIYARFGVSPDANADEYSDVIQFKILNPSMHFEGWLLDEDKWYYVLNPYDDYYYYIRNWRSIEGKWYYFDPNTAQMMTGWVEDENKWYYMNPSGEMAVGWIYNQNKWYYLNPSGEMKTGWFQYGGKWYYLNASGEMAKGWIQDKNKWYYLNTSGEMQTGWIYESGKWYYLNPSGEMAVGLKTINYKSYYFYSSGEMATGWVYDQNKWYYFMPSGQAAFGPVYVDGKKYYFSGTGQLLN
ncbi:hypothetical protein WAX78_17760 [Bacillus sp. FJAT-53711]|uniref:Uncharacterized protein n=1 Tax=Bacillus yunxiaonensis TaxID=3127665 RepID=A0ABU8FZ34_9BACI